MILQELLENALKFRGQSPPEAHVSSAIDTTGFRLVVRDKGLGISPEQHGAIFAPFRQLHAPGAYPGTGMGLPVAERLAERLGGRITVDSEPGRGSTFTVLLPANHSGVT